MSTDLTFNDKAALFLTRISGNMKTCWAFIICYAIWVIWNRYAPVGARFDNSEFTILLSISNFIQLMYMPVIQTGTNLLDKHSGERTHIDYENIQKEFAELKELVSTQNDKINELNITIQNLISKSV